MTLNRISVDDWIIRTTEENESKSIIDFIQGREPYINNKVLGKVFDNFNEECPRLKPIEDYMYQELNEVCDLHQTKVNLERLNEEVAESGEITDEIRGLYSEYIESIMKQMQEVEDNHKYITTEKDNMYRERILGQDNDETIKDLDFQDKVKDQIVKNQQYENQLLKIQNVFLKMKGGKEVLANIIYGKLNVTSLLCEMKCNVSYSPEMKRNYKNGYAAIKNNFIFIFKSENDSTLIDIILIEKNAVSIGDDTENNKTFCFLVGDIIISVGNKDLRDIWIRTINNCKKWYQATINPS